MDLNLLSTFVAVVESGSMTQAARRLKQPVSRVSRAMVRLERDLNQHLILRTTRSFQITNAGRSLFQEVQPIIQQISGLEKSLGGESEELSGLVRITAPEDFGQVWLAPIIAEISKLHPMLVFDLNFTDEFVDLVRTETDIGIRGGKLKDSTLKAKYLGQSNFHFVAAPSYIDKFGAPKKPEELEKHRCIYSPLGPSSLRNEWTITNGVRKARIAFKPNWKVNHKGVAMALAKSGLGITLLPTSLSVALFESKDLVHVLPSWGLEAAPVHLVYPPQRITSRKVREVSAFLEMKLKPMLKS